MFSGGVSSLAVCRSRIGPLFEEDTLLGCFAPVLARAEARIKEGHVEDVYAYRRRQRFGVRYGDLKIRRTLRKPVPSPATNYPLALKKAHCRLPVRRG